MTGILRNAAVRTQLAAMSTFLIVGALCLALHTNGSPAIIATVIAVSLSRRSARGEHPHILIDALGLVFVGVAATAVGLLLRAHIGIGAAVFTLAVGLSVFLRGYGDDARLIGRAIALPFITLLVVPPPSDPHPLARVLVGAGPLIALAIVRILNPPSPADETPREPRRKSALRPPPHVRMALQTTVALALAFALGLWLVPEHWSWCVLTAFIVSASARGRADAIYTGMMRTLGALAGAVIATLVAFTVPPNGTLVTVLIFAVLFAGLALRRANYAYWAAATTAIFALLAQFQATLSPHLVELRIVGIIIGGVCGALAASTLFPISTVDIVRRRLADALARIDALDEANRAQVARLLEDDLKELHAFTAPLRIRRLVRRWEDDPVVWIALTRELPACVANEAIAVEHLRGYAKRTRAAIRDRDGVGATLKRLVGFVEATTVTSNP